MAHVYSRLSYIGLQEMTDQADKLAYEEQVYILPMHMYVLPV